MPGVVLIVSISDICLLPYFLYSHEYRLTRNTVYCAILSDKMVVGCALGVPISYFKLHIDTFSRVIQVSTRILYVYSKMRLTLSDATNKN